MLEKFEYRSITVIVVLALLFIFLFSKIKQFVRHVFGDLDKMEFGGLVFTGIFIYMLIKEGHREHEWHLYSESTYFFVGVVAVTGLGLGKALKTIENVKLGRIDDGNTKTGEVISNT